MELSVLFAINYRIEQLSDCVFIDITASFRSFPHYPFVFIDIPDLFLHFWKFLRFPQLPESQTECRFPASSLSP